MKTELLNMNEMLGIPGHGVANLMGITPQTWSTLRTGKKILTRQHRVILNLILRLHKLGALHEIKKILKNEAAKKITYAAASAKRHGKAKAKRKFYDAKFFTPLEVTAYKFVVELNLDVNPRCPECNQIDAEPLENNCTEQYQCGDCGNNYLATNNDGVYSGE